MASRDFCLSQPPTETVHFRIRKPHWGSELAKVDMFVKVDFSKKSTFVKVDFRKILASSAVLGRELMRAGLVPENPPSSQQSWKSQ